MSDDRAAAEAADDRLRRTVAVACQILAGEGHTDLCFGHVSARHPKGVAIKVAGCGLDEVGPDEVAIRLVDGSTHPADARLGDELPLHLAVYEARPDVGAVVHTHAPAAVVIGHEPAALGYINQDASQIIGRVAAIDDCAMIVTPKSGAALARRIGPHDAALLRAHGLVTVGADVQDATIRAVQLERACRLSLAARAASITLTPELVGLDDLRLHLEAAAARRNDAIWHYLARRHAGA